ncbi:MAG: 30S ribosomal protein S16 [Terrimicrobiaceae bacterium]
MEIIGKYDPKKEGENFSIELERADHWVNNGARPSQTVGSIITKARKKLAA